MNSYEIKIKQFTNKFRNRTREQLINNLNTVRKQFKTDEGKVKEKYQIFLKRIAPLNLPSPPSFTSWKYVVYYKHNFEDLDYLKHIGG